jgi:hypothetical protein
MEIRIGKQALLQGGVHRFLVGDAHDKAPESVRSQNESLPFYWWRAIRFSPRQSHEREELGPQWTAIREENLGGGSHAQRSRAG